MTVETNVSGNARVIVCAGPVTLNDGRDLMVSALRIFDDTDAEVLRFAAGG